MNNIEFYEKRIAEICAQFSALYAAKLQTTAVSMRRELAADYSRLFDNLLNLLTDTIKEYEQQRKD